MEQTTNWPDHHDEGNGQSSGLSVIRSRDAVRQGGALRAPSTAWPPTERTGKYAKAYLNRERSEVTLRSKV